MSIKTKNKLISPLKVIAFLVAMIFTGNVYAEYYLVYSVPVIACCQSHQKIKRHLHKTHKPIVKKHKTVKRSHYRIEVYYPCMMTPCGACVVQCAPREYVTSIPPPDSYYYSSRTEYYEYSYNPDMSTGDDNASRHPDMDIDY